MASCFTCLIIVACCLGMALLTSGCNVTADYGLQAFEVDNVKDGSWLFGVILYLDKTEQYYSAIRKIEEVWPTDPWTNLKKANRPKKISVGIMKCHTFVVHMMCSATQWVRKSVILIRRMMDDNIKNQNEISADDICTFSKTLNKYVINLATILYNMGYAVPMWLPMLVILCDDLNTKTCINYNKTNFKNEVDEYLNRTVDEILKKIDDFSNRCKSEGHPEVDFAPNDSIKRDQQSLNYYFSDVNNNFQKRTTVYFSYEEDLSNKFLVENWLTITLNRTVKTKKELKKVLIPDMLYLEIDWEDERNIMSKTNIEKYREFKSKNKNWMMEIFKKKYKSKNSILHQIRLIYLTVVTRFVLIGVSECDSLRKQIIKIGMPKDNSEFIKMKEAFKKACSKILDNVDKANKYLGGERFLVVLKPKLSTFINNFDQNESNIVLTVMDQLNSLSGLLKVNAFRNYSATTNFFPNATFADDEFIEEALKTSEAEKYTNDLQSSAPFLDFKVAKAIELATNHTWISSLPANFQEHDSI